MNASVVAAATPTGGARSRTDRVHLERQRPLRVPAVVEAQSGVAMSKPAPLPAAIDLDLANALTRALDPDPSKRPSASELTAIFETVVARASRQPIASA